MGLVYDPERVGSGNIPADAGGQAQHEAATALGVSLAELATGPSYKDRELLMYLLYGSAAEHSFRHQANRRSDVDLLVVTNTFVEDARINTAVRQRVSAVEGDFNVDVNPFLYSSQELSGNKRVNPFYAEHLRMVQLTTTDPNLKYIPRFRHETERPIDQALFGRLPFVEAWPFAVEYLKARRAQFQAQLDQTEPDLTALKGPFELPRNLGRTMVDFFMKYMEDHTGVYNDELAEDSAAEVLSYKFDDFRLPYHEGLLVVADATDTLGAIEDDVRRLQELDTFYTGLLESTIAGDISIANYEKWLRSVYNESLQRAFKLASLADAMVYRTVEMAKLDPNYDTLEVWEYEGGVYDEELVQVRRNASEVGISQIKPDAYDPDRLIFETSDRFPEVAERERQFQARRAEGRRQDAQREREYQAWIASSRTQA